MGDGERERTPHPQHLLRDARDLAPGDYVLEYDLDAAPAPATQDAKAMVDSDR